MIVWSKMIPSQMLRHLRISLFLPILLNQLFILVADHFNIKGLDFEVYLFFNAILLLFKFRLFKMGFKRILLWNAFRHLPWVLRLVYSDCSFYFNSFVFKVKIRIFLSAIFSIYALADFILRDCEFLILQIALLWNLVSQRWLILLLLAKPLRIFHFYFWMEDLIILL